MLFGWNKTNMSAIVLKTMMREVTLVIVIVPKSGVQLLQAIIKIG
jgi:hypothetical protein